jgi:hypothetical protein
MAHSNLPTVALMQPTLVSKPFHRPGWVYEEKVDGWRMVAIKAAATFQLPVRTACAASLGGASRPRGTS